MLTLDYGRPPWVALVLAFSFGSYGLCKKQAGAPAVESLTLDREEPALRDGGRQRLSRVRVVGGECRGLFLRRRASVAQAAPDVELQ